MIIAQISDSHIDPESDKLKDRLTDLRRVVDNINIQDPTPGITKQSAVIASALNDGQ